MTGTDETRIYQCVLGECRGFEKPGGVTNTLESYLEESLVREERLTTHIDELQNELEYIHGEIRKARFALIVFEDDANIAEALQIAEGDTKEGEPDGLHCGKARVTDIENCGTQRQALYIIARINGGHLDLNPASELIVAARLSKATPRSVGGNLHTYLSNSEDFEWIGPSQFRLKSDSEDELTTGDEMALTERHKRAA